LGITHLVLGGARSGKSAFAEQQATQSGLSVLYIATAHAGDGEMAQRIAHHRARRPENWTSLEVPLHLAQALQQNATADSCIIVDCLTLWLTNLFFAGHAAAQAEAGEAIDCPLLTKEINNLLEIFPQLPGRILFVSNEVGWGIVPEKPVARAFADEQGRLNQQVAAACNRVSLVVAGILVELKRN